MMPNDDNSSATLEKKTGTPATPPQDRKTIKHEKSSRSAAIIAGVALFIAMLAIAETAVFWNQLNRWHRKSVHRETRFMTTVDENNTNLNKFNQVLQNLQNSLNQQQTQLNNHQAISRYLLERSQNNRSYWVLMEVQQLLELANLRLQYGRDLPGALLLVHAADQQLHASTDADLLNLRQTLSNDIAALEAVPKVDVAGILARITTLSNNLNQLTLATAKTASSAKEHHRHHSKWQTAWQHTLESLQKLVVIRYHNEPIEPLLPEEQTQYLLQKMQLRLEQAQWAVLHNNNAIYANSLQQVSEWIKHYYANSQPTTINILEELAELQKINVDPNLPNLSPTLALVKQLTQKPPMPAALPPSKINKVEPQSKPVVTPPSANPPAPAPAAVQGPKP